MINQMKTKTTTIRCSKKNNDGTAMTTNSGMKVSEDEHSLTVGIEVRLY